MLSFAHLVIPAIFLSYLLTASPTILWRDTPEFANAAFTLSIAHPAGFPTYSLLVKALTFVPSGNIAFKTNLASALFSLLSVVLLISTLKLLIRRLYPSAASADIQTSSILGGFLFALGPIVWHNAIIAEVYTLNTLFLAGLIYLVLRWLDGFDPRWLYLGAFLYGLSAGNHATVALFLPGLLAVYFFNRQERNSREWIRVIFFFLLGISVYLYLPVRSLANPPYDWGDPENLKNFLYQITDQKDFRPTDYTPESSTTTLYLIFNHLGLIARQFSPLGAALILLGLVPALRREKGLSLLFLWILFSNHVFFWGWTFGDAFLPSYLVLTLSLGVGTCALLATARRWSRTTASQIRKLVGVGLIGIIAVHVFFAYPKVNKRDYYLPSDFYRPAFAGLGPEAILLTELQWFHLKYFQNIERLREDIPVISLGEILNPRAFRPLAPERHPSLVFPVNDPTGDNSLSFLSQFQNQNFNAGRSIYWDLTHIPYVTIDQTLLPHQGFLFRYLNEPVKPTKLGQWDSHFEKLWEKMLRAAQSGGLRDPDLGFHFSSYMQFILRYLKAHERRGEESLSFQRLHLRLHGPEGNNSIDEKQLSRLYNTIGLSELRQGETLKGLKSLELAIHYDPKNLDPYLNLALWSLERAPSQFSDILERARGNGLRPKDICATLADYVLKKKMINQSQQVLALCRGQR